MPASKGVIQTAYDWHGGQWSGLYSFASTGGNVWSEEHRSQLDAEIREALDQAVAPEMWPHDSIREVARLEKLWDHILHAPIASRSDMPSDSAPKLWWKRNPTSTMNRPFQCLECGQKLTTKQAEKSMYGDRGCPGCGGADIELSPLPPLRKANPMRGAKPLKVKSDELVKEFGKTGHEELYELNLDFIWESGQEAYKFELESSGSENDAEASRETAELEANSEIFGHWQDSFGQVKSWYEFAGLDLEYVNLDEALVTPTVSWSDAADKIRGFINGVGYFYFGSLREALDSGPYTPRQFVEGHMHWIKWGPEIWGGDSPPRR